MKTLNVKLTNNEELTQKWKMITPFKGILFIRCNSKGVINWDKAPVYNLDELLKRGDVNIIKSSTVPTELKDLVQFIKGFNLIEKLWHIICK